MLPNIGRFFLPPCDEPGTQSLSSAPVFSCAHTTPPQSSRRLHPRFNRLWVPDPAAAFPTRRTIRRHRRPPFLAHPCNRMRRHRRSPRLSFRPSARDQEVIPRSIENGSEQACAPVAWHSGRRLDVFGVATLLRSTTPSAKPSDYEGVRTPQCLRNADDGRAGAAPILRMAGTQALAARLALKSPTKHKAFSLEPNFHRLRIRPVSMNGGISQASHIAPDSHLPQLQRSYVMKPRAAEPWRGAPG